MLKNIYARVFALFTHTFLNQITKKITGPKGVPMIVTSDGRTIRYPDPLIRINDTIVYDMTESKIKDFMSLEPGELS